MRWGSCIVLRGPDQANVDNFSRRKRIVPNIVPFSYLITRFRGGTRSITLGDDTSTTVDWPGTDGQPSWQLDGIYKLRPWDDHSISDNRWKADG